jgi:hypothetical protein
MRKMNLKLIMSGKVSQLEMGNTVMSFLSSLDERNPIPNDHKLKYKSMCPLFFLPPENGGRKLRTITMVTPKTCLLSDNMYELEILRLLALFDRNNNQVETMINSTLERLDDACFGQFCDKGECFETSIIALRFLNTALVGESPDLERLLKKIRMHFYDKKRHSGTMFYLWLTISELPIALARPEIEKDMNILTNALQKSYVLNSELDRYINLQCKYILRNCLSRLQQYEYLQHRKPYVSERDGRLHFNIE